MKSFHDFHRLKKVSNETLAYAVTNAKILAMNGLNPNNYGMLLPSGHEVSLHQVARYINTSYRKPAVMAILAKNAEEEATVEVAKEDEDGTL